jgi:ribosomal protein L16/L10AE
MNEELEHERAAHRQTVELLEAERAAHAETKRFALATMEAADIRMRQLEAALA